MNESITPSIYSDACGKAIIIGEHSVLYGAEAIAIPLIKSRVYLKITKTKQEKSNLDIGTIKINNFQEIIDCVFRELNCEIRTIKIEGYSNLLIGSGLGSSAALSVSLVKASLKLVNKKLNTPQLSEVANKIETIFHGRSSGLDTSVISNEKVISFKMNKGSKIVEFKKPNNSKYWPFIIINSGNKSSTKTMINKISPYFKGKNGDNRINKFNKLSQIAKKGLINGDILSVGESMNEASCLLREAGAMTSSLEDIVDQCKKMGTYGAKLTGAGGGGCVIALLNPNKQRQYQEMEAVFGKENIMLAEI